MTKWLKEKKRKEKKGKKESTRTVKNKGTRERGKKKRIANVLFVIFFFFSSCLDCDPRTSTRGEKVYSNELFHRDTAGNKDVLTVKKGPNAYNYRGQKVRGDVETWKWSGQLLSHVVAHPLALEDSGSLVARGNEKSPRERVFYPLSLFLSFFALDLATANFKLWHGSFYHPS